MQSTTTLNAYLGIGVAICCEDIQATCHCPLEIHLVCIGEGTAIGIIYPNLIIGSATLCTQLLIGKNSVVKLCTEVVEANRSIVIATQLQILRKADTCRKSLLDIITKVGNHRLATRSEHPDIIGKDACTSIAKTCRCTQHSRGSDVPANVRTGRYDKTLLGRVISSVIGYAATIILRKTDIRSTHPVATKTKYQ